MNEVGEANSVIWGHLNTKLTILFHMSEPQCMKEWHTCSFNIFRILRQKPKSLIWFQPYISLPFSPSHPQPVLDALFSFCLKISTRKVIRKNLCERKVHVLLIIAINSRNSISNEGLTQIPFELEPLSSRILLSTAFVQWNRHIQWAAGLITALHNSNCPGGEEPASLRLFKGVTCLTSFLISLYYFQPALPQEWFPVKISRKFTGWKHTARGQVPTAFMSDTDYYTMPLVTGLAGG